MPTPITEIYLAEDIREIEARAKSRYDISGDVMMQRAGLAAFQFLIQQWSHVKEIAVICGMGNNGGDGFVVARLAQESGLKVRVWTVGDASNLKGEARTTYEACQKSNVFITPCRGSIDFTHAELVVDALYGIGFQGEMRAEGRVVIEAINQSCLPVLSLDIPSGVDANTGNVSSIAVNADVTITFIGLKFGLLTGAGIACAGELVCNNLQLPTELFTPKRDTVKRLSHCQFSSYLKPRPRDWHKGNAGHVLIIGGDEGFSGATKMAAEAALRVGAGLVTIATHPAHAELMNVTHPEIMAQGVKSPSALKELLNKVTMVVLGPGLGKSSWSKAMFYTAIETTLPMVVDADGLNWLSQKPFSHPNWILTPHPGEAARLLKTTSREIQANRLAAVKKLQQQYGGISVLKGAGTLVLAPNDHVGLCDAGNPGMATAGMGDVLSGVIGGLVGQGIPLAVAAKLGVCLHAHAGDLAAEKGERGMVATDLMPYLRQLVNL